MFFQGREEEICERMWNKIHKMNLLQMKKRRRRSGGGGGDLGKLSVMLLLLFSSLLLCALTFVRPVSGEPRKQQQQQGDGNKNSRGKTKCWAGKFEARNFNVS